jgi:hypothetical protein
MKIYVTHEYPCVGEQIKVIILDNFCVHYCSRWNITGPSIWDFSIHLIKKANLMSLLHGYKRDGGFVGWVKVRTGFSNAHHLLLQNLGYHVHE